MHPIERLRFVARAGDADAGLLALEAAEALGDLAREPRALVIACRRLLEFHPDCGPLWWTAAHVLSAADPAAAARLAARRISEDPTVEELAAAFPAGALVATDAAGSGAEALAQRPDCDVRLVGTPSALRYATSRFGRGGRAEADVRVSGFCPEELAEALAGRPLVVVEARAAGPDGYVLNLDAAELARAARAAGLELWVVAGVGRVLPGPLFSACASSAAGGQLLAASEAARIVGPDGPTDPLSALGRADCPAPAELLNSLSR